MTEHYPWPITVHLVEDVGGVLIEEDGQHMQIRCGCREDLLYDFGDGHAEAESA